MLIAKDYEILRGVKASGAIKIPLAREPKRVATLINEGKLKASGGELDHLESVFLDDRFHDWNWSNGFLTYCSHAVRVNDVADVVVVYEISK